MDTPIERPIHFLLVEDDAAIADMLILLCEGEGYRITWCASAADTLAFLAPRPAHEEPPPDVMLLDLALGTTSGVALLQQLSALHSSVPPVVLVSAGAERALQSAADSVGAVAMLQKPFDPEALLRLLATITGAPGSRRAPAPPAAGELRPDA